jgi:lipopolysaccharide export system permease protein
MKKIDSYILKKYLSTFFFCLTLFTVVVVVVDISEKTDDFVRIKFSAWQIFTQYYIGFIPHLDAMLFPLFVFLSVIFFTAKMADRSEIVAILSSGVSFRRFLFPYWIGGFLLTILLWIGYQFVLPQANTIWGNFLSKYIDSNVPVIENKTQDMYFKTDPNTYAEIRYYDTTTKGGSYFFIQRFENNQMTYNLRSEYITWDTATRKWKLTNVMERYFSGTREKVIRNKSLLMTYNFKPQDIRSDDYFKDRLTTKELDQFIEMQKMRGGEDVSTLLVEKYNRNATPVSVIILSIIGAVLASRKTRGGSGFHLGLGVILSVLYILCSRLSVVFATKGNFTPLLAAWVPNIIFGALAFYLYKRAQK